MRLSNEVQWPQVNLGTVIRCATVAALVAALLGRPAHGADDSSTAEALRASMADAWWTGPLLAANASTLPAGHLYFEPYFYDVMPYAHFDGRGHPQAVSSANDFGSLSYVNYGVTDELTVGTIPRLGYDSVSGGSSAGVELGDLTLQAQYRLSQFQPGHRTPTISVNVQETLPTGRYDRLQRPADGFGAGADTTTISMFTQTYVWMPSGRILRTRLNLSYSFSNRVRLEDISIYGTSQNFRGYASPGTSGYGDLAFEYSLSRDWVAAIDFWYQHDGSTDLFGAYASPGKASSRIAIASGSGTESILGPALEYNWSARFGLIVGARVIVAGRNETASVAPVTAISCFF
jgi:hypothetical protein